MPWDDCRARDRNWSWTPKTFRSPLITTYFLPLCHATISCDKEKYTCWIEVPWCIKHLLFINQKVFASEEALRYHLHRLHKYYNVFLCILMFYSWIYIYVAIKKLKLENHFPNILLCTIPALVCYVLQFPLLFTQHKLVIFVRRRIYCREIFHGVDQKTYLSKKIFCYNLASIHFRISSNEKFTVCKSKLAVHRTENVRIVIFYIVSD